MSDFLIVGLCKISRPGTLYEPETFIPKVDNHIEQCRFSARSVSGGPGNYSKMVSLLAGLTTADCRQRVADLHTWPRRLKPCKELS